MQSTTEAKSAAGNGERRVRLVGDRVVCRRIGPTDVRRCEECVYLLRLGSKYVVCRDGDIPDQPDFAW